MSGADLRSPQRGPILVELVGPPGAGKSTIFETLRHREAKIEPRPLPRKRSYVGVLGWHLLAMLSTVVRHRMLLRLDAETLRALAYLRALPGILRRLPSDRIVVFDQGPLFLLTRPQPLDRRLAPWHARTCARWSALLDVVVLLDASDAVLVERINTRSKEHRVKGCSVESAVDFIARIRAVYEDALQAIGAHACGPTMLRFDTSQLSVAEVVDEIIEAVARVRSGPDVRTASSSP